MLEDELRLGINLHDDDDWDRIRPNAGCPLRLTATRTISCAYVL
jgi:hypothetical protein